MPRPLAVALMLLTATLPRAALGDYQTGVWAWAHGDYAAAAAAFLPAAEAGERESQYMMGRLYALGDGVPRDFVRAWLWFDRAARNGHVQAADARASLEQILTPPQLATAHQLARPPEPPPPVPQQTAQVAPPPRLDAAPPPLREAPRVVESPGERPLLLLPRRGPVTLMPSGADQQQAAR